MEETFEEIIQSSRPVLIDFFATWCGPCRAMTPVLSELGARLGDRISIVEIDVDQHTDLAVKMKVMGCLPS
jgi:thioredoxin 1